MATVSLSQTTRPKSDQLNAEDFLAGAKTLTITGICINPASDQPVMIYTDFDSSKPYKPSKTQRKILSATWGDIEIEANQLSNIWNGRKLTLFRDPDIEWAGKKEGGIVISHMSHLDRELRFLLQQKKGKKREYTIKRLADDPLTNHANALSYAASIGVQSLRDAWMLVPKQFQAQLKAHLDGLKPTAEAADLAAKSNGEQSFDPAIQEPAKKEEEPPAPTENPPLPVDNF